MPKSVFIRIRQANINFTMTRTELHKLKEILSEFGIKEAFLKNHMGSPLNPSRENEAWHNVMTRNQTLDRFLLGFASASVSFYWDTTPELWSFWNTVSFMLASRSNRSKIGKRIILMMKRIGVYEKLRDAVKQYCIRVGASMLARFTDDIICGQLVYGNENKFNAVTYSMLFEHMIYMDGMYSMTKHDVQLVSRKIKKLTKNIWVVNE